MIVQTATDSYYQFDADVLRVRRISSSHDMRGDSYWQELYQKPTLVIGESMILIMNPLDDDTDVTIRHTSRIVNIYEDDDAGTFKWRVTREGSL